MRFGKLDLNLLVALDVLLETQSVTETARRLNLSQPSVSAALGRMRHYFGDDLLVQVGRRMLPTAKGEELAPAIREMLNIARFRITNVDRYDPAQSNRRFRIIASDYAFDVLVARVLAAAERLAPSVSFEISSPHPQRTREFNDGDIDLMLTIADYAVEDHPIELLFTDEDAVICWNRGPFAGGISADQFRSARHAVAVFGQAQLPIRPEDVGLPGGYQRDIQIRVPGFAALPGAVVGTSRVATMHRRHAVFFAPFQPIAIHPYPLGGSEIRELMQWHRMRDNDAGLQWLMRIVRDQVAAAGMAPPCDPPQQAGGR